jgi:hypothetical protein
LEKLLSGYSGELYSQCNAVMLRSYKTMSNLEKTHKDTKAESESLRETAHTLQLWLLCWGELELAKLAPQPLANQAEQPLANQAPRDKSLRDRIGPLPRCCTCTDSQCESGTACTCTMKDLACTSCEPTNFACSNPYGHSHSESLRVKRAEEKTRLLQNQLREAKAEQTNQVQKLQQQLETKQKIEVDLQVKLNALESRVESWTKQVVENPKPPSSPKKKVRCIPLFFFFVGISHEFVILCQNLISLMFLSFLLLCRLKNIKPLWIKRP